ncbi:MAG: GDP-mannose 4,6-dehydratase, partial [Kiritimatiellia bacterium]|nr:GDP-mannose 4,6-dehydratase [Kiritimatiellia bacterium]
MKILVTGSAGFIGYHAAEALLKAGHEVVGVDNFNPYYSVALKRARAAELDRREGFTGIEADLAEPRVLPEIFEKHRFDSVCHLAAQPGVRYSISHPFAYERSNLDGFLRILEACRHGAISRLVYASSSSVYGGSPKLPFCETDPVDRPISLYAATKRANELM